MLKRNYTTIKIIGILCLAIGTPFALYYAGLSSPAPNPHMHNQVCTPRIEAATYYIQAPPVQKGRHKYQYSLASSENSITAMIAHYTKEYPQISVAVGLVCTIILLWVGWTLRENRKKLNKQVIANQNGPYIDHEQTTQRGGTTTNNPQKATNNGGALVQSLPQDANDNRYGYLNSQNIATMPYNQQEDEIAKLTGMGYTKKEQNDLKRFQQQNGKLLFSDDNKAQDEQDNMLNRNIYQNMSGRDSEYNTDIGNLYDQHALNHESQYDKTDNGDITNASTDAENKNENKQPLGQNKKSTVQNMKDWFSMSRTERKKQKEKNKQEQEKEKALQHTLNVLGRMIGAEKSKAKKKQVNASDIKIFEKLLDEDFSNLALSAEQKWDTFRNKKSTLRFDMKYMHKNYQELKSLFSENALSLKTIIAIFPNVTYIAVKRINYDGAMYASSLSQAFIADLQTQLSNLTIPNKLETIIIKTQADQITLTTKFPGWEAIATPYKKKDKKKKGTQILLTKTGIPISNKMDLLSDGEATDYESDTTLLNDDDKLEKADTHISTTATETDTDYMTETEIGQNLSNDDSSLQDSQHFFPLSTLNNNNNTVSTSKITKDDKQHTETVLDFMIHGEKLPSNYNITDHDVKIFKQLFNNHLALNMFRKKQEMLRINIEHMHHYYEDFRDLLFESNNEPTNVLSIKQLLTLFPNTISINCKNADCIGWDHDQAHGQYDRTIKQSFLETLHKQLSAIESNELIEIVINTGAQNVLEAKVDLMEQEFNKLNWLIAKEKNTIVLLKSSHSYFSNENGLFAKLQYMIRGVALNKKYTFRPSDIALIKQLWGATLNNSKMNMPKKWITFREEQSKLKFDMIYMYWYYKAFMPLVFSSKKDHTHVLMFKNILKIFPNVTQIKCNNTDYVGKDAEEHQADKNGFSSAIVGQAFIAGLRVQIDKISDKTSLQKILIRTGANAIALQPEDYSAFNNTRNNEINMELENDSQLNTSNEDIVIIQKEEETNQPTWKIEQAKYKYKKNRQIILTKLGVEAPSKKANSLLSSSMYMQHDRGADTDDYLTTDNEDSADDTDTGSINQLNLGYDTGDDNDAGNNKPMTSTDKKFMMKKLKPMLTGQPLPKTYRVTPEDAKTLKQVLRNRKIWKNFGKQEKVLTINIEHMYKYYNHIRPLLFGANDKVNNVLLVDQITNAFPNAISILCKNIDCIGWNHHLKKGIYLDNLNIASNISALLIGLKNRLSRVAGDKNHQLKEIMLSTSPRKDITKQVNFRANEFNALGWVIGNEKNVIVLREASHHNINNNLINKIDNMLKGKTLKKKEGLNQIDVAMTQQLWAPNINSTKLNTSQKWKNLTNKESVQFNMEYMHKEYKAFNSLFFSGNNQSKNIIQLEQVTKIFPKANRIIVQNIDYIGYDPMDHDSNGYTADIINKDFIEGLLESLRNIEQDKNNQLQTIVFTTNQVEIEDSYALAPTLFAQHGWHIQRTGKNQINLTRASATTIYQNIVEKGLKPKIKHLINGKTPHSSNLTTTSIISILEQLISDQKDQNILEDGQYILAEVWDEFSNQQQKLTIDIQDMHFYYKDLKPLFMAKTPQNLLRFDRITALFPKAKKIICNNANNINGGNATKSYSPVIVNDDFIQGLKDSLSKIDYDSALEKIVINTDKYKINAVRNLLEDQFNELGWEITKKNFQIKLTKKTTKEPSKKASKSNKKKNQLNNDDHNNQTNNKMTDTEEDYDTEYATDNQDDENYLNDNLPKNQEKLFKHTLKGLERMVEGKGLEAFTASDSRRYSQLAKPVNSSLYAPQSQNIPYKAQETWKKFRKKKQLKFNMQYMDRDFNNLKPALVSTETKNLLLFGQIIQIFPKVTQITCTETDYNATKHVHDPSIVNNNFLKELRAWVLTTVKPNSKPNKLEKIIIQTKTNLTKDEYSSFPEQFDLLGWKMDINQNKQITLTKQITHDNIDYTTGVDTTDDEADLTTDMDIIDKQNDTQNKLTRSDELLQNNDDQKNEQPLASQNTPQQTIVKIIKPMIKGQALPREVNAEEVDRNNFQGLLSAELETDEWDNFRKAQEELKFYMRYMYRDYHLLVNLVFSENTKNLLQLDTLTKAFPNLKTITCDTVDWVGNQKNKDNQKGDTSPNIVDQKFMIGLQAQLKNIYKPSKLEKIILKIGNKKTNPKFKKKHFTTIGWSIKKEKKNSQIILTKNKKQKR